jgi:hypothetical protein
LVEAERTPLVVAGERGGQRVVWCGFDLRESDLPLRVAFPIFITNSLRWLSAPRGPSAQNEGAPLRAGEPVPLVVPRDAREITIIAPDKTKSTVRVRAGEQGILFDQANQVGVYQAQSGDWNQISRFRCSIKAKATSRRVRLLKLVKAENRSAPKTPPAPIANCGAI